MNLYKTEMPNPNCSPLPDQRNWRFDLIEANDAKRAEKLENAGTPDSLLQSVQLAFERSMTDQTARFGWEQLSIEPKACRIVIQFPVTPELFDWFFNARTGYRAHFRAHDTCGLKFNTDLVERVRNTVNTCVSAKLNVRLLDEAFKDLGQIQISKTDALDSLVVDLSKVWNCTLLIQRDGSIRSLGAGGVGPRILLSSSETWAALSRQACDAWLDVKGAFLRASGPYQHKGPKNRAKKLHSTGEA